MKTIPFSLKILDPDMIADPDEVRPENSEDRMDGEMLFFLKNHILLNPRRLGAIPGCNPWTRPILPLIKVFLLVDNLPIIIQ